MLIVLVFSHTFLIKNGSKHYRTIIIIIIIIIVKVMIKWLSLLLPKASKFNHLIITLTIIIMRK